MISVRLRFHPSARREFFRAADYYDENVSGLGDRFGERFEEALSTMREYPQVGAPYLLATRRLLIAGFPHSIVYRINGEELGILAVPHHRRRPAYWRNRRL